ncbi:Ribosomal RNA methyltransferase RrmJ/FtsJ [Akanthomyces lecanii RCEF 1005]|uniref:Ribosomal RNA methyltransferase RrmJ/FtsJ n=1 Tax=Akanthomyces lecanii RCEF 1005 TaxID=1081108 RepID=A0A168ATA9_CORDF|nr:Ribosomal RNA methyltransferase RrmJ/FtsJ [Akanthomyces lecanii RCEF 1005]
MFTKDKGMKTIPTSHPDAENFLPRQLEPTRVFDLVVCDGWVGCVLRTHKRLEYRENREARRLSTTQFAIGLKHLRVGGTMIILLHKLDSYETASLIHRFQEFSKVQLLKPTSGHTRKSSFYMVASNVQSQQPAALDAIEQWKQKWKVATFGKDEGYLELLRDDLNGVNVLLEMFDALAKAPFIRNHGDAALAENSSHNS